MDWFLYLKPWNIDNSFGREEITRLLKGFTLILICDSVYLFHSDTSEY